jgi:DNA-binding XRE family transcriptional regulator
MARKTNPRRAPNPPEHALNEAPQTEFGRGRSDVESAAGVQAKHFGALVRERREALKMRQDDLALATGVGRRFILELEAGKASCQLGRALVVAAAVGLRPFDLMNANNDHDADDLPDLEDDGRG